MGDHREDLVSGTYHTISTMDQDGRQGRYHPHLNISRFERPSEGVVQVKCFSCGAYWEHPMGEVANVPERCDG